MIHSILRKSKTDFLYYSKNTPQSGIYPFGSNKGTNQLQDGGTKNH